MFCCPSRREGKEGKKDHRAVPTQSSCIEKKKKKSLLPPPAHLLPCRLSAIERKEKKGGLQPLPLSRWFSFISSFREAKRKKEKKGKPRRRFCPPVSPNAGKRGGPGLVPLRRQKQGEKKKKGAFFQGPLPPFLGQKGYKKGKKKKKGEPPRALISSGKCRCPAFRCFWAGKGKTLLETMMPKKKKKEHHAKR